MLHLQVQFEIHVAFAGKCCPFLALRRDLKSTIINSLRNSALKQNQSLFKAALFCALPNPSRGSFGAMTQELFVGAVRKFWEILGNFLKLFNFFSNF